MLVFLFSLQVKNIINSEKLRSAERKLRQGNDGGHTPMNFLRAASRIFGTTTLMESLERDPLLGGEIIDIEKEYDVGDSQVWLFLMSFQLVENNLTLFQGQHPS